MDWKFVLDASKISGAQLYNEELINKWILENLRYPFFVWNGEMFMVGVGGPYKTDYRLINGRIKTEHNIISQISFALHNGRIKIRDGEWKWKEYTLRSTVLPGKFGEEKEYKVSIQDDSGKWLGSCIGVKQKAKKKNEKRKQEVA